jgi:hypothetical protein
MWHWTESIFALFSCTINLQQNLLPNSFASSHLSLSLTLFIFRSLSLLRGESNSRKREREEKRKKKKKEKRRREREEGAGEWRIKQEKDFLVRWNTIYVALTSKNALQLCYSNCKLNSRIHQQNRSSQNDENVIFFRLVRNQQKIVIMDFFQIPTILTWHEL